MPQQNGIVEMLNQFILDIARALHFDSEILKAYWKYPVQTANYLRNTITTIRDEDGTQITPYGVWTGEEPDVSQLRIQGCRVE